MTTDDTITVPRAALVELVRAANWVVVNLTGKHSDELLSALAPFADLQE